MADKFCVNLTCAKDNPDKATVAFVIANAAAGSGKETLVFLSIEADPLLRRATRTTSAKRASPHSRS